MEFTREIGLSSLQPFNFPNFFIPLLFSLHIYFLSLFLSSFLSSFFLLSFFLSSSLPFCLSFIHSLLLYHFICFFSTFMSRICYYLHLKTDSVALFLIYQSHYIPGQTGEKSRGERGAERASVLAKVSCKVLRMEAPKMLFTILQKHLRKGGLSRCAFIRKEERK